MQGSFQNFIFSISMKQIIHLSPSSRWEVLFSDADCWRVGMYRPEFERPEDIYELEKHTCPELFVCVRGKAGLVIRNGREERILEFMPGDALMVEDYHAGFIIEPEGFFLVVERASFETEYIDRTTGAIIRKVEARP